MRFWMWLMHRRLARIEANQLAILEILTDENKGQLDALRLRLAASRQGLAHAVQANTPT